jgi:hypothetical protein
MSLPAWNPARVFVVLAILGMLLAACGSPTPESVSTQIVSAYSSVETQPWLADLYACAQDQGIIMRLSDAEAEAEIRLRVGEPEFLDLPAYQIGTVQVVAVVNPQNKVSLGREQVAGLFDGRVRNWQEVGGVDAPVQVWVMPGGDDLQQVFDKNLLGGGPVSSLARQASGPDEIVRAVAADVNAIGLLPGYRVTSSVRSIDLELNAPVLAITQTEPQGAVRALIACLQK